MNFPRMILRFLTLFSMNNGQLSAKHHPQWFSLSSTTIYEVVNFFCCFITATSSINQHESPTSQSQTRSRRIKWLRNSFHLNDILMRCYKVRQIRLTSQLNVSGARELRIQRGQRKPSKAYQRNYLSRDWHGEIDKRHRPQTTIFCHGSVDRTRWSRAAAASMCCWCSPAKREKREKFPKLCNFPELFEVRNCRKCWNWIMSRQRNGAFAINLEYYVIMSRFRYRCFSHPTTNYQIATWRRVSLRSRSQAFMRW